MSNFMGNSFRKVSCVETRFYAIGIARHIFMDA